MRILKGVILSIAGLLLLILIQGATGLPVFEVAVTLALVLVIAFKLGSLFSS